MDSILEKVPFTKAFLCPYAIMSWYYNQLFVTPPYPTRLFSDQTIIVTGANVGLGFEAARHFARLKALRVILAVRNVQAGEEAKREIEKSTNRPGCCEVWQLDLGSFASVKAFARKAATLRRLDIVVENAGVANPESFVQVEGHEKHITINVISTFLLALLLLPTLQATANAFPDTSPHLTVVTSEMHIFTEFPERHETNIIAALNDSSKTNMTERYSTSKLIEVLLVRELAPKVSRMGVVMNMVNPGLCHSKLARDYDWKFGLMKLILARSTEVGSRTLVAGASAGPNSDGAYMSDSVVADEKLSSFVTSDEGIATQHKLWDQLKSVLEDIAPGCTVFVS